MPEIRVINVSKRYGDIIALDNVNIVVEDREYVCIIGPSGSGKTTLLKIIAGILEPDEGDVLVDGESVLGVPIEERGIGLVMQDVVLFPHMNVWENIVYSPLVKGLAPRIINDIGREVTDYLTLSIDKKMYPDEISRGGQQKVALARALASDPKLLLLDEPLGSIDAETAKRLRFELRKLVKDLGLTAIHITHNQEEALSIADKVVVMRKGRVEQVGKPLELYLKPRTPFICRFIGGEANFFEGHVKKRVDGHLVVELKGKHIIRVPKTDGVDGRVVVVVRPEDISIIENPVEEGIEGVVEEVSFLGAYYRIQVSTSEGTIIVKKSGRERIPSRGDRVTILFRNVYTYRYPEKGLVEAIAYE